MKESKYKFISKADFLNLLNILSKEYNVVVPYGDDNYFFAPYKGKFVFNPYRAVTSLRQFLLPSQEKLSNYFQDKPYERKPFCIVGVKNCDLFSMKIQDFVFIGGEITDKSYEFMRKNNFIISSDCTASKSVCFCRHLGIEPYPQDSFDLNLTPVEEGFLIELDSDKGTELVNKNSSLFAEPKDDFFVIQKKMRQENINTLEVNIKYMTLPSQKDFYKLIVEGYDHEVWQEEALKCVECGACIMNCPTCHCFLLFDDREGNEFIRARTWDGCQYKNFARVAGGANPLMFRIQRLRNRYIKKFEFFFIHLGIYACTGCGRCIENCIGKIDLREIFRRLAKNTKVNLG